MPNERLLDNSLQSWIVQPGEAIVFPINIGDGFRITDLNGSQVSDILAISRDDKRETVSTAETMNLNFSFQVPVGEHFYTNKRKPALKFTRDDSDGAHDLTNACCSTEFYEKLSGLQGHPNCRDAFDDEFSKVGVDWWELPNPINIFQITKRAEDGSFIDQPAGTSPNAAIEMVAEMNLWIGVSCCPCNLESETGSITGDKPTPVKVEILKK